MILDLIYFIKKKIYICLTNQINNKKMEFNFLALLAAVAANLVIGFVWYNPKVFGTVWLRETGINVDTDKKPNMIKVFGGHIVYAFFMAILLQFLVIHQTGAFGMVGGMPEKALPSYAAFMNDYGSAFRTFKHGALHGAMAGLFFAFPLFGITALYEGKSFKYVLITGGYWIVSLAVMGGIICCWK